MNVYLRECGCSCGCMDECVSVGANACESVCGWLVGCLC